MTNINIPLTNTEYDILKNTEPYLRKTKFLYELRPDRYLEFEIGYGIYGFILNEWDSDKQEVIMTIGSHCD